MTRANGDKAAVAVPVAGTALVLIDVINDLAFDGSDALVAHAESMAAPLARLNHAIRQIETVLKGNVALSGRLRFHAIPGSRITRRR
jgi:hypothetical protein